MRYLKNLFMLEDNRCFLRKKIVGKLVEECTENVEEVKLAKITLAEVEEIIAFAV